MSEGNADRLQAIQQELSGILEERVAALMVAMRGAEEVSRRIVSTELELTRTRQLRETLEEETGRLLSDLEAMKANAEEVRHRHEECLRERDAIREETHTLEREVQEAEREVQRARIRTRDLERENDSLRQENVELKIKLRTLEENVGRMRKLRDELLSSITNLSQQMGSLGNGGGE